jgi:hypothetical protein
MRKDWKSRKQILSVLDDLKGTSIPCEITLYYLGEEFNRTENRGIPIDLNRIPMGIIKGDNDYSLWVTVDTETFILGTQKLSSNERTIPDFYQLINDKYGEYMINYKRKTRLKKILSDPNPPVLIPDK